MISHLPLYREKITQINTTFIAKYFQPVLDILVLLLIIAYPPHHWYIAPTALLLVFFKITERYTNYFCVLSKGGSISFCSVFFTVDLFKWLAKNEFLVSLKVNRLHVFVT